MANKIEELEKTKRRTAIFKLIQLGNYKTQVEIVDALESEGIFSTQSTVSRDIREMKIERDDHKAYKISPETLQDKYLDELQTLLSESPIRYYKNVATHYMKVEKGKASLYAFHLQQAFPSVILDVSINMDSLVLLVNMDAETKGFFDMLKNS